MNYGFEPEEQFKALKKPAKNPFGWYVMAEDATIENLWFLSIDNKVRIRDKTVGFFFASELDAWVASMVYYDSFDGVHKPPCRI